MRGSKKLMIGLAAATIYVSATTSGNSLLVEAVENKKADVTATKTGDIAAANEAIFHIPSTSEAVFAETFQEIEVINDSKWIKSTSEKYASQSVSVEKSSNLQGEFTKDKRIILEQPAKHYGIARKLEKPFYLDGSKGRKEMVVQYEVKLTDGLTCGGAYIKLLRDDKNLDLTTFNDQTPFVIMFGPDKCAETNKVHFIFQHKNPLSKKYEEKHLEVPPSAQTDRNSHLYTLVVRDDNTYEIMIDQESVKKGSLLEDFKPAVIPPKKIDDPSDTKPKDWVDEAQIRDPDAKKPEDWDEEAPRMISDESAVKPKDWLDNEPQTIADPKAPKPEDWDEEEDGTWEAPQIPNPKCEKVSGCGEWKRPMKVNPEYKGKWEAPLIDNPLYKGEWKPKQISNKDYFEDKHPARMDPIGAVAIEVWTMSGGIAFDNFWLGHDVKKALEFSKKTWQPKNILEKQIEGDKKKENDEKYRLAGEKKDMKSQLEYYWNQLVKLAVEQPVYGVGMLIAAVVSLFGLMKFCGGKRDMPPLESAEEKLKDEDKEEDTEESEEPEDKHSKHEEEDEEDQPSVRRRKTPKAE